MLFINTSTNQYLEFGSVLPLCIGQEMIFLPGLIQFNRKPSYIIFQHFQSQDYPKRLGKVFSPLFSAIYISNPAYFTYLYNIKT